MRPAILHTLALIAAAAFGAALGLARSRGWL